MSSAGRWVSGSKGSGSSYLIVDDEERLVVLVARLVVDGELLIVDGAARKCSELSLLEGPSYIYIQYSSSSSSL